MNELTNIELNAILYYADYLSLQHDSIPVTDTPKYYFIYRCPINVAYLVDAEPVYDSTNRWVKQAKSEYLAIRDKFDEDGVTSFIEDICNIAACGVVGWERMLQYVHQFSSKKERTAAYEKCEQHLKNIKYKHEVKDDDGNPQTQTCSKYVYHFERSRRGREIQEIYGEDKEEPARYTD